jgi:molecular chaperone DnaK
MEKLGAESQALGQAIYESAQAEQPAGGAGSGSSADDVVDVEVVEDDQEQR